VAFFRIKKKTKSQSGDQPSFYPPIHPSEHDEKGSYHPLKDLAKSGYKPYMKYKFVFFIILQYLFWGTD
jgi:hypothetical protein